MSTATTTALPPGETVERVRAILPIIEASRDWADEHGRMAPVVLAATREAGLYMATAPVEVGGSNTPLPDLVQIFEDLGYHDATVGWHAGNSYGITAHLVMYLDEPLRSQIVHEGCGPFGFAGAPSGRARQVDGGYVLSGTWPFMTGSLDAAWADLHGFVVDEQGNQQTLAGQPDLRSFLLPAEDFAVGSSWTNAAAMRGTGSNSVTVTDVFVPNERAISLIQRPERRVSSVYYRFSPAAAQVPNAAMVLGLTHRVVDEVIAILRTKVAGYSGQAYRESLSMQRELGAAMATVEGLHHAMMAVAADTWQRMLDRNIDNDVRRRAFTTNLWVFDTCRRVATDTMVLATSTVYANWNVIEKSVRDIHAICAASEPLRMYQEAAGRVLLGMPPNAPPDFL